MAGFRMLDGETLAGLLENYAQVAQQTGSSWRNYPTSMPPIRCLRRPGLSPAPAGRHAGCCYT